MDAKSATALQGPFYDTQRPDKPDTPIGRLYRYVGTYHAPDVKLDQLDQEYYLGANIIDLYLYYDPTPPANSVIRRGIEMAEYQVECIAYLNFRGRHGMEHRMEFFKAANLRSYAERHPHAFTPEMTDAMEATLRTLQSDHNRA